MCFSNKQKGVIVLVPLNRNHHSPSCFTGVWNSCELSELASPPSGYNFRLTYTSHTLSHTICGQYSSCAPSLPASLPAPSPGMAPRILPHTRHIRSIGWRSDQTYFSWTDTHFFAVFMTFPRNHIESLLVLLSAEPLSTLQRPSWMPLDQARMWTPRSSRLLIRSRD